MKNKKAVMAVLAGLISIIGIGWYSTDKASSAVTDNSSHAGEKDSCASEAGGHDAHDGHGEEGGHDEHGEKIVKLSDAAIKEFGVETAAAGKGMLQVHVSLPAEIVINADRKAHIVPRVPGVVKAVHGNLGAKVREGDVLAVIESRELADIKAAYLAAKEKLVLAQATFEREEMLWKKKISAELEYLDARRTLADASIEVRSSEQKLHALGFSEQYIGDLSNSAEESFVKFEVRSPIDGTIIEKHITLGEVLKDDSEVFTIANLTDVWANINIHQKDISKIQQGARAEIVSDKLKAEGTIAYLSSTAAENTRTVLARVVVPNDEGHWRPGTFATGRLLTDELTAAIVISKEAIISLDGKTCIFIKTEEGFKAQIVSVGLMNDVNAEITNGLESGQVCVTKGASTLKSEMNKLTTDPCGH